MMRRDIKNMESLAIGATAVALIFSVAVLNLLSIHDKHHEEIDIQEEVVPPDISIISTPIPILNSELLMITPTPETEPILTPESTPEPTPDPVEEELHYLGNFKITAYCSCEKCCGYWATTRPLDENGEPIVYTASGARAEANKTIAVDTNLIPFGTEIVINGHTYVAQDTGSAVKDKIIDIYFDDHQEAWDWGCQYLDVYMKMGV